MYKLSLFLAQASAHFGPSVSRNMDYKKHMIKVRNMKTKKVDGCNLSTKKRGHTV